MFKIGDRVQVINRNNQKGIIQEITQYGPILYYNILLDDENVISENENSFIKDVPLTPFNLFREAKFGSKETFIVGSILNKVYSNVNDVISTLKNSKTSYFPYQFKPLIKFLKSANQRILIADEVGLGKTIEAGYILSEMYMRGKVQNCLVICKSSLKTKWKNELFNKFGFDFKIVGSRQTKSIDEDLLPDMTIKDFFNKIRDDIDEGVKSNFTILNMDYSKERVDELLSLLQNNSYHFDMIIVDEAHMIRNSESIRHYAIKELVNLSNSVVFLTATPVMTSQENLYNLVKVLDKSYEEYNATPGLGYFLFLDHITLSRPFIHASNLLSSGSAIKEILSELFNTTLKLSNNNQPVLVSKRFENDPIFLRIKKLSEKNNHESKDRAALQKMLSDLNSFQDIITRTTRREIQTDQKLIVTRSAKPQFIKLSDFEFKIYIDIIDKYDGHPLELVTRKRQATSSLPAFALNILKNEGLYHKLKSNDSKYKIFYEIIEEICIKHKKKVIVFSYYKATLSYIEETLQKNKIKTLKIDGDVASYERQPIVDKFQTTNDIYILLSSEVGSEGLDFQFADTIINYDLPWNPMVVEQRIGRIDRIGQKSNVINIFNLCLSNTVEEKIYRRLLERIQIFKNSIGSLEDILSSEDGKFEKLDSFMTYYYSQKITEEQEEKRLKEIETAIEAAKEQEESIKENLTNTQIGEKYIFDEIDIIQNQHRYITNSDVKEILRYIFQGRLLNLRLDLITTPHRIRWNYNQTDLFDFIDNYLKKNRKGQSYKSYLKFKQKYIKKTEIIFTLDSNSIINNDIEFITLSHPLIQASLKYFSETQKSKNNTYSFIIKKEQFHSNTLVCTKYLLFKYLFEKRKYSDINTKPEVQFEEDFLIYKIHSNDEFEKVSDSEKNDILKIDIEQWESNEILNPDKRFTTKILDKILPFANNDLIILKNSISSDYNEKHVSKEMRIIETEIHLLQRQIEKNLSIIDKSSAIKYIYESENEKLKKRIIEINDRSKKIGTEVLESLQSISLIQII